MVEALPYFYQICNIIKKTLKNPTMYYCNKLGRPPLCNIVINREDPRPPITYYVIYGQPLSNESSLDLLKSKFIVGRWAL